MVGGCHQTHRLKIILEELEGEDHHQTHHLKIALEELEGEDHYQTHHLKIALEELEVGSLQHQVHSGKQL